MPSLINAPAFSVGHPAYGHDTANYHEFCHSTRGVYVALIHRGVPPDDAWEQVQKLDHSDYIHVSFQKGFAAVEVKRLLYYR